MKKYIKIIDILLLALCMIVIFYLSNENADESTDTSVSATIEVVDKVSFHKVSDETSNMIANTYFEPIRKSAHIIEYFILGLLIINIIKDYTKVDYLCLFSCVILCFIYAVSDEMHQLFIPGRSCEIKDVFIDTIGGSIGIIVYYLIYKRIKKMSM